VLCGCEEVRLEHASEWAAIESVASNLGIGSTQTVHNWVRKAEVDAGARPGTTGVESAGARLVLRDSVDFTVL
jgi:transposase